MSFSYWNFIGLATHNFTESSLMQAFSVTYDYDVICLSETFLDSSNSNEDERINIEGYSLLWVDHQCKKKRGICIRTTFLLFKEIIYAT